MLAVFQNAWKVPEIRKKLYFILMMLAVYRLGCHIGLPGIDAQALVAAGQGDINLMMLLMGGNQGTIFAMGIQPYITASIIMQLLTVAIPYLERLKKEGEEGRKKINQITRIAAVALALVQGSATVFSMSVSGFYRHGYNNMFIYAISVVSIVTGTMFIMWISELITEKGIGNGSSFIITANILSGLPQGLLYLWSVATGGNALDTILVIVVVILFAFIVAFTVLIQEGERRLPVQYSKKMVGKQLYGGQTSYIPVKVNIAGVMSIIFANALLGIPQLLNGFFPGTTWIANWMSFFHTTSPTGAVLYVFLIFCFTFFYTSFAVNPVEMAENMKKNGGAIPGVRSGKPTSDYIQRTVTRLSWIGACFYSTIAMIPVIIEWVTGIRVGFGGTTMLIVVGVSLELVKQMESQLLTRHYKGFLS
ncbi:MAG: preprotein translocase subunit SecY [Defluviitaleaceae bacterium]|nr:preprotein translocase subunit SecY [Defluviitaleaceae bacterium]MCL2836667.1 preprotein translocase subunit SecY [Defluviitaleaceae bacterium]